MDARTAKMLTGYRDELDGRFERCTLVLAEISVYEDIDDPIHLDHLVRRYRRRGVYDSLPVLLWLNDPRGGLLDGHHRTLAAWRVGFEAIPAVRPV